MAPTGSHLGLSHLYRTAAPVMDSSIGHFLQHAIHMIPRKSLPVCHSSVFPDYSSPDPIPGGLQQPSGWCRITSIIVACLAPNHNFSWKNLPDLYRNLSSNRSGLVSHSSLVLVEDFFLRPASFLPANFYSSIYYTCSNFTVSSDLILSTSDLASALVSMKHETTNYSFASRYFQSRLFWKQDLFHDLRIKLMS